uniref:lymphocyte-specific helicase-like n=1 Tax=Ciona intestinalis TaxID=7719 RepID=UPI000180C4B7|nr:lymphocyte-specific helicase-like [Ciona intestinalis]|eukprot:XP_026691907.1 lymphocyte-specific helicase-like [Ciona intestinalis]
MSTIVKQEMDDNNDKENQGLNTSRPGLKEEVVTKVLKDSGNIGCDDVQGDGSGSEYEDCRDEISSSPVSTTSDAWESLAGDPVSDNPLMTSSMMEEEKKLSSEGQKSETELKQRSLKEWKEISEEKRLKQLNHLLEKSSVYANYLLNVIDTCKEEEKKKMERREKRKKKKLASAKKVEKPVKNLRAKKRKAEEKVVVEKSQPVKRKKKNETPDSNFSIGDKVHVKKISHDHEEDLVEANVTDVCFMNDVYKYQVHYVGAGKKANEWIEEKMILVLDDEDQDEDGVKKKKNVSEVDIGKINKDDLLASKLYMGDGGKQEARIKVINGVMQINGQDVPPNQPEYLTGGVLRPYQITGFEWLKVLFDNAVNGILADEMGLGKTIQCIAMICRLVKSGFTGPFLVCAPLSTICNWINEFKRFAPRIPVLLYHGSAAERCILASTISHLSPDLGCHPVVVTSYEVLIRDRPTLGKHSWEYLIVDEGHRIKNMNCRLIRELKALKVNAKLLLTGTPLQNNLSELWSLLNFLLPEVFNDLSTFEAWFDLKKIQKGIESQQQQDVVIKLQKILVPFLLRRTKSDIQIYLPPKKELIVFAPLSESQNEIYQAIVNRTIRQYLHEDKDKDEQNELALERISNDSNQSDQGFYERETRSSTLATRQGKEREDRMTYDDESVVNVSLSNLMMQLRKCCNHPYLIKYPLIPGTDIFRVDEELISSSGKLQLLDRMLPVLKKKGHKILLFSQMTSLLDILEDFCNFRNHSYVRLDGSTKCEVRQERIDEYNRDPDLFIFLLSTRAGGLGINLTSADTVVIYDSDWNPQNDLQAQDRCHRIGQTRSVLIYRFVSSNTVDQFMVERAEAKRVLERMIINRNKFKGKLAEDLNSKEGTSSVSTQLLSLLQQNKSEKTMPAISDKDLVEIMDRENVMKSEKLETNHCLISSSVV